MKREKIERERVTPDSIESDEPDLDSSPDTDDDGGDAPSKKEKYDQIIYIGPDWRLCWDGLQYQAQTRRIKEKNGAEYWRIIGYFRFLGEAITFLMIRRISIIPGVYGPEALLKLDTAIEEIRQEIRATLGEEHFARKILDCRVT